MINRIVLSNFKNVKLFESEIAAINVLVGANNSGKSSALQGIHFTILAEVVRRKTQRSTISQEELLYIPSSDFSLLRHGAPYSNYSGNTGSLTLISNSTDADKNVESFKITIKKAKNYGNISVETSPNNAFRQSVTSPINLYSVYVPGISGIATSEKLFAPSVVRRAAASGDANLYLRNVLYYIMVNNELLDLNTLVKAIFPMFEILVSYDPDQDIDITVLVDNGNQSLPIEFCGTGFLQIVQLMSYAILYKPKLFLLDEPDEHLHPDNQYLLAKALVLLQNKFDMQVILSTHSRHLLSALNGDAKFIWMKEGSVQETDTSSSLYEILLDIGAFDVYDRIVGGVYTCIFFTEDQDKEMIKRLFTYNGFDMNKTAVITYKGCSNIENSILLASYIHISAPQCKVIIHRDRDFMTDDEIRKVSSRISSQNTIPFITKGSDIESYFIDARHIASILGKDVTEVQNWLDDIAINNHVDLQSKFQYKREEIKHTLYRESPDDCPSFIDLFGRAIPTLPQNRLGKFMIAKVRGDIFRKFGIESDLLSNSEFLQVQELQEIKRLCFQA